LETLEVGGAEKLASRLVQHMEKGAYQPIVCCLSSGSLKEEITSKGVPVISFNLVRHSMLAFPLFFWDVLKMLSGLTRIVQSRKAALIHAHLPDCAILAGIVGKMLGVKVVATFHGLKMFPFTRHPWAIRNLMRRVFYRVVFSLVDRCIAVSEPVAEMLTQSYGLVAPQMVLIKNGVAVDEYEVNLTHSSVPSGLGLSHQSSVVTCVGRLVSNKGQKTLLFAIQEVIKLYPNVKLLLVGDGPLRIELGNVITQLGLDDHVSLVGERPDVAEILAITNIFVLPSFAEGIICVSS
jgi:glycosyltransferase involved in cell wall biosynthesis